MTWGAIAGTVVSGVIGSSASRRASRGQQEAADAATAEQARQYDQNIQRQQPFYDAGVGALGRLSGMNFQAPTAESVMSDPGYQFGLKQGQDGIQSTAAAKGGLYSGNALKALTQYGNDYATNKYNDAFERQRSAFNTQTGFLGNLVNSGTGAAQQQQNAGTNYANNVGNLWTSNANAQGAAGIAQGNIWGNTINRGISDYKNRKSPGVAIDGYNYNNLDMESHYADGGAVRKEPVIGSRTSVPGGTAMSREAILAAIRSQNAPVAPQEGSMAALPANPVTNPQAILAERLKKAEAGMKNGGRVNMAKGGPVKGKGGPRSDAIKALLSNGEHVIDTASVNALGGGDNDAGQDKLDALRMLLKMGA